MTFGKKQKSGLRSRALCLHGKGVKEEEEEEEQAAEEEEGRGSETGV